MSFETYSLYQLMNDESTLQLSSHLNTTCTSTENIDSKSYPSIAIIVLTWENYEIAAECLDSLESITYPNYRVIVVDNGSKDTSPERLQKEYNWCEFVVNEENEGFTKGNNAGIRYALDTGAEYILLLNDDTIVFEDFLQPLVEVIQQRDNVAAVGGINLFVESGEIHNAGYSFHPWLAAKGSPYCSPRSSEPYLVDYVQSCLVLLNPEFLEEVGLLNESYFLGMEDVDLAWKARQKGWEVLTAPESRIYHYVGQTAGRTPFSAYHKIRNKLQFAVENLSPLKRIPLYLSVTAETAWLFIQWAINSETRKMRATILGAYDYVRNAEFRDYEELV